MREREGHRSIIGLSPSRRDRRALAFYGTEFGKRWLIPPSKQKEVNRR